MPIPTSEKELTALFRQLGAREPQEWAHSQVAEGIPQLLRFLFLKQAWGCVIAEGDDQWIDRVIENSSRRPDAPYAGLGAALSLCRAQGVPDEALTDIARCLQAEMLFGLACLLDGPAYEPGPLEDLSWGLFQTDEGGRPVGPQVGGLHESVLELDPTGREMRPRS